jgi:hypothetical protein
MRKLFPTLLFASLALYSCSSLQSEKDRVVGLWNWGAIINGTKMEGKVLYQKDGVEYGDMIVYSGIVPIDIKILADWDVSDGRLIETVKKSNSLIGIYLSGSTATSQIVDVSDKYLILSINGKEITCTKLDDAMINDFKNSFNTDAASTGLNSEQKSAPQEIKGDSAKSIQTNTTTNDIVYENEDSIVNSLNKNHSFIGSDISTDGKDTFEISGITVRFIANKMLFFISTGRPEGCTGSLCGLATKNGDNKWKFYSKDESGETKLMFELKKTSDTLITVTENGLSPYHGERCGFQGTYIKEHK